MVSAKESLHKLLRTRMLWCAVLLLLVLTRWAHLEFRSLHNLTAYQALKASQLDSGSIDMLTDMLTSSRAPVGTAVDARTLWLMGRYHLYDSEPTRATGSLGEAADVLSSDYQVHRDLLYAYGSAEAPEEFVREYERGRAIRRSLRDTIASGGGPVVYVDALSSGSFDHQNPRSREVVLVNYTRFVDARLAEGSVLSAIPKLMLLGELFNQDLLVLSRTDALCQMHWEDALCTETSLEQLRDLRWRAWEDARLTGLMADLAMQLYDQSVWSEMEVLALGRYLVWQHTGEAETAHFLGEVSARGLDGSAWWELSEELAWRNELADRMVTQPEEAVAPIEGNLLADPSALLDDTQGQYVSLGQQQRQWHLWVSDDPAYGEGRGYIGGVDGHVCLGGEVALRLDGLWSDPGKSGPDTGVGFVSNQFTLEPGAEYELSFLFRIPQSHPIPQVTVEFLPDEVFGPRRSYRMALVEGQWTFRQELAVGDQRAVRGNVRVRYLGYGPLWVCAPRLLCKNCDQPAGLVQPVPDDYQVHVSEPSLQCQDCTLASDYQQHRDLLYTYDETGEFEEFVREYERGEGMRQLLRDLMRLGGGAMEQFLQDSVAPGSELPVRAGVLLSGGFDIQDPSSQEVVLVNYVRSIDAKLEGGDVQAAASRLLLLRKSFDRDLNDLLMLSRVYQTCQMHWEDALCSEVALDALRKFRLQAWEDARLTGLLAVPALRLYDEGLWTEMELLSLGRYLVWQHAGEVETTDFLGDVSGRGLSDGVWSALAEELAWRRDLAAGGAEPRTVEGSLLADAPEWRLEVHDTAPYGGGSYMGGVDDYACRNGERALRVDGLWLDSTSDHGGLDAWAGFVSNEFILEPGRVYELGLTFGSAQSRPLLGLTVEFLPEDLFGPQPLRRLALAEGEWSFRQRLTVWGQTAVSARVRVRYLGYGPLWLCEPRLVCENCDQPAGTVQPLSDEYQVHLSDSSLRCEECVIIDYQVHRDLLYAYDRAGEPERFVQEYEKGQGTRQLLRNIIGAAFQMDQLLQSAVASGSELPVRANVLSEGGFDLQNPGSREMVLVNYIPLIDASLEQGDVQGVASRLAFLKDAFSADFLVLPRLYQLCQLQWEDELCAGVSPDTLRRFRLGAWEDARLTDLFASTALWLYDEELWTEMELLSLGRYLVWQHGGEVETAGFLEKVSGRGLGVGVWSELAEELARRQDPAACIAAPRPVEGNLLADASQWRLDIRDVAPYGGGSYVGGTDDCACPNGESALRIDGLWRGPRGGGLAAWAGFESNEFTLQSGAEYELGLAFRLADPRAGLYVEFLPEHLFGPENSYRLPSEADKWLVVQQSLTVRSPKDVSAQLRVRYLGYGPLWLCEPRLLCKECDEPAEAGQPSSGGYRVHLSEPVLMCKDCTNS